jgi:hypothetical protein
MPSKVLAKLQVLRHVGCAYLMFECLLQCYEVAIYTGMGDTVVKQSKFVVKIAALKQARTVK